MIGIAGEHRFSAGFAYILLCEHRASFCSLAKPEAIGLSEHARARVGFAGKPILEAN